MKKFIFFLIGTIILGCVYNVGARVLVFSNSDIKIPNPIKWSVNDYYGNIQRIDTIINDFKIVLGFFPDEKNKYLDNFGNYYIPNVGIAIISKPGETKYIPDTLLFDHNLFKYTSWYPGDDVNKFDMRPLPSLEIVKGDTIGFRIYGCEFDTDYTFELDIKFWRTGFQIKDTPYIFYTDEYGDEWSRLGEFE